MHLTNLFVYPQPSPTSTTSAFMVNPVMFQPLNTSSPLPMLKPHFQAAPAIPPYHRLPTKTFGSGLIIISTFSHPHVTLSHPQASEQVVISDSWILSNFPRVKQFSNLSHTSSPPSHVVPALQVPPITHFRSTPSLVKCIIVPGSKCAHKQI